MRAQAEPIRADRVELILEQLDSLPTPSPVAMRLLKLTSADDAEIDEIVSLVQADAALTGKLLALCRRANTGLGDSVLTVERAVVMLGFEAVRSALLSVHLHGFFAAADPNERAGGESIDRGGLWRHTLAVACASEKIVEGHRKELGGIKPEEAFVAGLLHDLGKHALDSIVPKTYGRVARIAERNFSSLAEVERRVIGVDHHTAGKRLAEAWGLPHALQDVIWLYGQPRNSLPDLEHEALIGVVTAANALARRLHIGCSGEGREAPEPAALCAEWGLDPERVREVELSLHERVSERIQVLGLEETGDQEIAVESILAANRRLAQLNAALQQRSRTTEWQARTLEAINEFHETSGRVRSLVGAIGAVAASASSLLGEGFFALITQTRSGQPWRVFECSSDGRVLRTHSADPPHGVKDLAEALADTNAAAANLSLLSWLTDYLSGSSDLRQVQLLPLRAGHNRPALLAHDRPIPQERLEGRGLRALAATWGAAIAAASNHEGARRLGEQLAEANRALMATQGALTEARSLARLGEFAAGAAHEMNNPLTVIRGRSQMLTRRLREIDEESTGAAWAIGEAASRLSDLITSLHLFADPPKPERRLENIPDLLGRVVRDLRRARESRGEAAPVVRMTVQGPFPSAWIDGAHVASAVEELLANAYDAGPEGLIELRAQIDEPDDRLVISVRDDGCGMSEHALRHAFDPFFSEKPAGRRAGLGLARARRLIDLHGGSIELESAPGQGTTARIILDDWRQPAESAPPEREAA